MNLPMYRHYLCPNCDGQIQLPLQTLGEMFGNQEFRSSGIYSLALPCPHCKQVRAYSLNRDSTFGQTSYQTGQVSLPGVPTLQLGPLSCVEATCTSRVLLLAQWSETTTEAERAADIETWIWDRLTCPEGHAVPKPIFQLNNPRPAE